jgi:TRAP-type C4-dicarboxylate transport system permease small subunit
MRWWSRARKGIQRLNFVLCVGGMFLLIPLMFMTTGDVIGRGFFARPIPGTVELSEYILAVFILLGAAYTQQVKGHVGVSFFTSRLSPRQATLSRVLTTLFSMIVIALVVWQGLIKAIEERTVSDMLRIPQYPFRSLVAIGGFLLWLELLIDLIDGIGKLKRREA